MKVLVIQLARLGDIFQTWPALAAFKRKYPNAQIDVLCRDKFRAAYEICPNISKIHVLPTKDLLAPLIKSECDIKGSFNLLSGFLSKLIEEDYQAIYNLSFSPVSSFITHQLTGISTSVTGYTRFHDGFLNIPDDMSAYFYAQVGPKLYNRYHLVEIFGTLMGVDLIKEDWSLSQLAGTGNKPTVLFHVGGSEAHKILSVEKMTNVINNLSRFGISDVTLVGAQHEAETAERIMAGVSAFGVKNAVGATDIKDLCAMVQRAALVIGPDSALMHIASLAGVPCLNISIGRTNFWETGPRSPGSCIIKGETEVDIPAEKIAGVASKILSGSKQDLGVITVKSGTPSYNVFSTKDSDFGWAFLQAIYTGTDFPSSDDPMFIDGIRRLKEVNTLIMEQLLQIQNGVEPAKLAPILDRGEEIIATLGNLVPHLSILVRWYQTEKTRIGPSDLKLIVSRTIEIHTLLEKVVDLYLAELPEEETVADSKSIVTPAEEK